MPFVTLKFNEDSYNKVSKFYHGDFWNTVKNLCVVAGSYPAWMTLSNRTKTVVPKDIDLFFKDEFSFNIVKQYLTNLECKQVYDTIFATSFSTETSVLKLISNKIQLIKPTTRIPTNTIDDLLDSFDFSVCRIALIPNDTRIPTHYLCDNHFTKDLKQKKLRLNTIHCPIGTLKRVMKYQKKGFNISTPEILKLFIDWDKRDLDYKFKLIDYFVNYNVEKYSKEDILSLLYVD